MSKISSINQSIRFSKLHREEHPGMRTWAEWLWIAEIVRHDLDVHFDGASIYQFKEGLIINQYVSISGMNANLWLNFNVF